MPEFRERNSETEDAIGRGRRVIEHKCAGNGKRRAGVRPKSNAKWVTTRRHSGKIKLRLKRFVSDVVTQQIIIFLTENIDCQENATEAARHMRRDGGIGNADAEWHSGVD